MGRRGASGVALPGGRANRSFLLSHDRSAVRRMEAPRTGSSAVRVQRRLVGPDGPSASRHGDRRVGHPRSDDARAARAEPYRGQVHGLPPLPPSPAALGLRPRGRQAAGDGSLSDRSGGRDAGRDREHRLRPVERDPADGRARLRRVLEQAEERGGLGGAPLSPRGRGGETEVRYATFAESLVLAYRTARGSYRVVLRSLAGGDVISVGASSEPIAAPSLEGLEGTDRGLYVTFGDRLLIVAARTTIFRGLEDPR